MNVKPIPAILILVAFSFVLLVVAFAVCQEEEPTTRKYYCMIPLDCESDDSPYSSEHKCKVTTSALVTATEPNEPECEHLNGFNVCTGVGCDCRPACLICETQWFPEPNEPKDQKPDTSKLVGGIKQIAELIEYYHPFDPRAYTCLKCYEGAKGDLCPGHIEPNESEPSESMTTYTAEELDEIYKDEPALGRLAKDLWGVGEGRIKITDLNEPMKYSLPIPTWPDYIELEKDLVLRYDFPEPNNPLLIHIPSEFWIIGKGTKIYFKEDE